MEGLLLDLREQKVREGKGHFSIPLAKGGGVACLKRSSSEFWLRNLSLASKTKDIQQGSDPDSLPERERKKQRTCSGFLQDCAKSLWLCGMLPTEHLPGSVFLSLAGATRAV